MIQSSLVGYQNAPYIAITVGGEFHWAFNMASRDIKFSVSIIGAGGADMSFSNSQAQVNLADVRVCCHAAVCLPSSMCSSRFGWLLRAWPRCVDQHLRCSDWQNGSDSCKNPKWLPLIAALTRRRDRAQSSSGEFTIMHGTCWSN